MGESTRGWIDLDDYDPAALDEANRLVDELEARGDAAYREELLKVAGPHRRIHGTSRPAIRSIGRQWLDKHADEHWTFLRAVCEILWASEWREPQLLTLFLIYKSEDLRDHVNWEFLSKWSMQTDNAEVIDYLGAAAAQVLGRNPRLIAQVNRLAISDDRMQRLFGLVTLIIASREEAWHPALVAIIDRLSADPDLAIQAHLAWARRRMSKPRL
jgi:3-methyladenine DNA glycosylase AlkD